MNRQRTRFYGTLLACFLGFGLLGGLLGWALHWSPVLAAVTLGLVIMGGAATRWCQRGRLVIGQELGADRSG
jgi:hypothetical protein